MEEELIAEVEQGHRRFRGCGCHRGQFGILSLGGACGILVTDGHCDVAA